MALNNGCLAVLPYGWTFLDECIDALLGIIGQHVVDHDFSGEIIRFGQGHFRLTIKGRLAIGEGCR